MNTTDISQAMKTIGAMGGKARARNLSAEKLSEIGRKGGKARARKAKKTKRQ